MKSINNLGYFDRQRLIDAIARKLAKEQGYEINCDNLTTSANYKVRSYLSLAKIALSEVENFLE